MIVSMRTTPRLPLLPSLLLLLLLPLLVGCEAGAPCTWTVTNDTGTPLETVRWVVSDGFEWSADVLADVPLEPNEPVAFDVDGGSTYDLQGFATDGSRYTRVGAITCEDGEAHTTSLSGPDRDM